MGADATTGFPSWKRELAVALAFIAAGVLILPIAVYAVGTQVFGQYGADLGAVDLLLHVWGDFGRGSPLAFLLVLGPYAVTLLLRFAWKLWRGDSVNPVTDSLEDS
jgi:hypothetical protein